LSHGAAIGHRNTQGQTLLHQVVASSAGLLPAVESALASDSSRLADQQGIADFVNATDNTGLTAIHLAVRKEAPVELLSDLARLPDVDLTTFGPPKSHFEELVPCISHMDVSGSSHRSDEPEAAVITRKQYSAFFNEILTRLEDHLRRPPAPGPITQESYERENGEAVDHRGAEDRNLLFDLTSIQQAQSLAQNPTFLDASSQTDRSGNSPTMHLIQTGKGDVAAELLRSGAHIEPRNKAGATVLHVAARKKHSAAFAEVVNRLENHFKSMSAKNTEDFANIQDNDQKTALHLVAEEPSMGPFAADLIRLGADPSLTDSEANVPLHCAAESGNVKCTEILLAAAPQTVNLQNKCGNTPLHSGINSPQISKILLDSGADFRVRNAKNRSAAHLAHEASLPSEMVIQTSMLRQLGAADGKIVIGLSWFTWDDLDIQCICPCGFTICCLRRKCPTCGGELDVDMNIAGPDGDKQYNSDIAAAEHIVFKTPKEGIYFLMVDFYTKRNEQKQMTCRVWAEKDGQIVWTEQLVPSLRYKYHVWPLEFKDDVLKKWVPPPRPPSPPRARSPPKKHTAPVNHYSAPRVPSPPPKRPPKTHSPL
jgi:ankyrin repeat protein